MATNVTIAEDSGPVLLATHSGANGISMTFAALTSVASNGMTYIETYINGNLVQTGQTGSAGQNVDYVFKVFFKPNPDAFGDFGTVAGTFSSGSVLGNDPPTPFSSTIHVTPVPDAPNNISISNSLFNENAVGAFVGTLSASDPDGPTTFNYQLFSDPSGLFEIRGADLFVKTGRAADFEARSSYDITIRVFDSTNMAFDKGFTIKVRDVNETPTITSNGGTGAAVVSIQENTTSVTKVAGSDPDAGATLGYSIAGGTDADKFQINASTGVLSFKAAPNFEAPADSDHNNSYVVTVRASDGSLFDEQTITVNVTDVPESVVDLTASNAVLDRAALNYRINNTGTGAAAASTAGIFLSTDSTITTSDTLLNTHATPALAGGASDLETALLVFPAALTPGTYFVGVIADYIGQVAENNETNNASSGIPIILGNNSANTLNGTTGNDTILGLGGNDTINGGAGDDTAVFSGNLAAYAVRDLGDRVLVSGPDGSDTVFATEHLQFADGTINYNDGDPLFDTIFYDRSNLDVFHAGVNAKAHYNVNGWHEGRDPNAFFSTGGYLAFNPDVKAAGANPLQHYDTSGWKEGRDPGANFDTEFYLLHAPDVKAAKIDPLAHYLQSGVNEGRAISPAVGDTIQQGGFDAEYYLFANPDVAAAHVNPLAHYNSSGHTELRNPNGYFDAAGYLAHNPDVAAAHVDPFLHYETSGWKEGRNPSTLFDTRSYLAANPDVAAAHINPLDHFLTNGIHEGRMPLGDGLWF
jgi:hypothetical protein